MAFSLQKIRPSQAVSPTAKATIFGTFTQVLARGVSLTVPGSLPMFKHLAPVAQLDRAAVYGTAGYRFESCRV